MKEINDFLQFSIENSCDKIYYKNFLENRNKNISIHGKSVIMIENNSLKALENFKKINRAFFPNIQTYNMLIEQKFGNTSIRIQLDSIIDDLKQHFDKTINYRGVKLKLNLSLESFKALKNSKFTYFYNDENINYILNHFDDYDIIEMELNEILISTLEERINQFPYLSFQIKINEIINCERPILEYNFKAKKDKNEFLNFKVIFFKNRITYDSNVDYDVISEFDNEKMNKMFNIDIGFSTIDVVIPIESLSLSNLRKISKTIGNILYTIPFQFK